MTLDVPLLAALYVVPPLVAAPALTLTLLLTLRRR